MFFLLSKTLALLVMPLTWIITCLVASYFVKASKWKKRLFFTGLLMLVVFSNQYLSNRAMLWWEPAPVLIETMDTYDVGIVFTGVTKSSKAPFDRVYFNNGADRITHTLQLYNQGKIKHILISGGLAFRQSETSTAAERLREFLIMAQVPDSVITVETEAVNTYENAVKTREILNKNFADQKYLLITSAFHMKRASLCLKKQDIVFDEFPAGYLTEYPTAKFDDLLIPKGSAIERWEKLSKEWVGIMTYKVMGYL